MLLLRVIEQAFRAFPGTGGLDILLRQEDSVITAGALHIRGERGGHVAQTALVLLLLVFRFT
ncbi:hypothetical protein GCM10008171_20970 [Methylopila jiangsuensis]|uniref:Uncharacterized protein n=1 Tax=Methylopila jiangsuensis TaxID=586230 RepID=A0A9W6N404_9HYPH|nr:hypothetical protein GCM10008171_20970 [Methylopila jiangsuensis]